MKMKRRRPPPDTGDGEAEDSKVDEEARGQV